jgi:hypothetical protein
MKLSGLSVLVCVSCGREDGLVKLPESMWPNARACVPCLQRHGRTVLARAADQVLANATPNRAAVGGGKCLHCGGPVIVGPDGVGTAWCTACEAERKGLQHGG